MSTTQDNLKLLAIESSGNVASVAILEQGKIIAELTMNNKKTHSTTLLPMIDQMIKMCEKNLNEFDGIAVTRGPGSFTGLRIGAATVKGLGLALDLPVIPVSTLECLAMNVVESHDIICPIMDARRNQVYTAAYEAKDGRLQEVLKEEPMDIKDLIEKLNVFDKKVLFLGDGVAVYQGVIEEELKEKACFAKEHNMVQRASSLAVLAKDKWEDRVTSKEFHLEYLRASQAEREWKEEHQGEELPCLS
ncbi:MAG: tRNA (adenosine(37)-N6)-threonylcarbamoyltransferase complex dimerization subunit type 1 TsaB [Lachnospiraceae bacterium]|nr:tRNA (adenosine(37)-N6)-threonylcarbamoyltransferase complex dimerization subunit type 1 TsaB [Lachnospiraceae bacterium]